MRQAGRTCAFVVVFLALAAAPAGAQTLTFSSGSGLVIPGLGPPVPPPPPGTQGQFSPYPSVVGVSGVDQAAVTSVSIRVRGLGHTSPRDLDLLLVGPGGGTTLLMSDVGGGPPGLVSPIDLVFSDAAAGNVPEFTTPLAGTYLPTEEPVSDDNLPPPAPVEPPVGGPGSGYGSTVAAAAAGGVNGVWSLFVFDDSSGNGGSIAGWDVVLTVPDPAPPAPVPCKGKTPTIVGTDADETLKGTGKADVISGLGGSDVISGLGKDDRLCGGDGNDVLKGGGGKDLMSGGAGEDTCKGSGGKDKAASCETKRSIP